MVEFRHMYGAVYIFENKEARRVKVGMTINRVGLRLKDVNDMWLNRKVTCQICGGRLLGVGGQVPQHVVSGKGCPGGDAEPLERDAALAEAHLDAMRQRQRKVSGTEKGSLTRKINTLKQRIGLFRHSDKRLGLWRPSCAYFTECAEEVELLSHDILREHLDEEAPFGEVFTCSALEAAEAVETALTRLGLLQAARKEADVDVG